MTSRLLAAAALSAALLVTSPAEAEVYLVDRIVAVVGKAPILLSTLRTRCLPFLTMARRQIEDETQLMIAESKVYRQMLDTLVNERLVARQAAQEQIAVIDGEVDKAIDSVAEQNSMTREELMAEIKRNSLTETSYRAEISRQILEGKVLMRRLAASPFMVTEAQLRARYDELKKADPDAVPSFEEARSQLTDHFRVQWMQEEKKRMLSQLRATIHVEVRLVP
ncbi:MAG: SurA N-terminal domain-containing protein [Deltaproteobacteria bacterium]|nr:SurA N-terminal domain-containing protein [Deltaproteobacteria bacterium]